MQLDSHLLVPVLAGVCLAVSSAASEAGPEVSGASTGAKKREGKHANAAAVKRGQSLYRAYQCCSCHVLDGKGATDGVPLDSVGRLRSSKFVRDHLRNPEDHVEKNPQAFKGEPNLMPEHGFSSSELNDLTSYLMTLRKAPAAVPRLKDKGD